MNRRRVWVGLGAMLASSGCAVTVDASRLAPPRQSRPLDGRLQAPSGYVIQRERLTLSGGGRIDAACLSRSDPTGTVLYCGGRGFRMDRSSRRAQRLAELTGANIVMFDYPGRGASEGVLESGGVEVFARDLLDAGRGRGWLDVAPLVVYGFSFGGLMAAQFAFAADFTVIEASSDNAPAVVEALLPAPVRALVKVRVGGNVVRYADALVEAGKPVLLIAGGSDSTVPPGLVLAFAEKLRQAGAQAGAVAVPGARHGDALYLPEGGAALQAFLGGGRTSTSVPNSP